MTEFFKDAAEYLPILLEGAKLTILVTLGSLVLSTVLGLVWALMRVSGNKYLSKFSAGVINLLRGIPIIVLLFYIYFVMPDMGIALTALQAAIIGLGIAYSAYQAENFRAGIEAIDRGQIEAAMAMGMSWSMTMRRVVLPRVLTLPEIAALCRDVPLEMEVFVFGGLCVMAEGRCSLSSYACGHSPNIDGACSPAQHVHYLERGDTIQSRLDDFTINTFGSGEPAGYPT